MGSLEVIPVRHVQQLQRQHKQSAAALRSSLEHGRHCIASATITQATLQLLETVPQDA